MKARARGSLAIGMGRARGDAQKMGARKVRRTEAMVGGCKADCGDFSRTKAGRDI